MVGSRLARILPLTILLGGFCIGILSRAEAQDTTPPTVVFAYPANGAANVSGKLRTVSVTFSEPMDRRYISFNYDGENWGPSSLSWSDDDTVFYVTRDTTHIIDDEITISFILNPSGHEIDFRDKTGNRLATDVHPPLWLIYTHAFDRDCLTTTVEGLERIDLQLVAMVEDAKARLGSMGYTMAEKIFINGYSASGSFANRFTLLHPEIIQAMASGSPGGWPTVPVSTWNNETLRYPVGIADLETLIGEPFNLATFRRVPQYIYVGDKDDNDAVDYRDGFDPEDEELINRLFGDGEPYIAERWPHAEAIFDSVHSNAQFVIYPGVGHTITQAMFGDLLGFFRKYHPGRFDLSHSILALRIAAGMDLDGANRVLDISGDGKIGLEEAVYALQMVAGLR